MNLKSFLLRINFVGDSRPENVSTQRWVGMLKYVESREAEQVDWDEMVNPFSVNCGVQLESHEEFKHRDKWELDMELNYLTQSNWRKIVGQTKNALIDKMNEESFESFPLQTVKFDNFESSDDFLREVEFQERWKEIWGLFPQDEQEWMQQGKDVPLTKIIENGTLYNVKFGLSVDFLGLNSRIGKLLENRNR